MILNAITLVPFGIGAPERFGYIKISNQANHDKYRNDAKEDKKASKERYQWT